MCRNTGWFKSSHSDSGNDNCVEVRITADQIGIRDSKAPATGGFSVAATAWTAFLADLKQI
ncbi:MAG: DUF397 domain-containing protein [Candidatus Dormibacteraceae bacterium]